MSNTKSNYINKKTLFICAYREVSVRYLLYSNIYNELSHDDNIRLVVLVDENNLSYFQEKFRLHNIIIEPIFYNRDLKTLKSPLGALFATYRLLTSPKGIRGENSTKILHHFQYKKEWSKAIRGKFIFIFISILALISSRFKIIRNLMIRLEGFFFKGSEYDKLFDKYKPSMLVVSSLGSMLDSYIMNSAKRNNTKVMTVFHNWDGPTTRGYKAVDIDHAIVWNSDMSNELVDFQDIEEDNIYIGGSASYDMYFEKINNNGVEDKNLFFKKYSLDLNKKIIFIAPGGQTLWPDGLEMLEGILQNIKNGTYAEDAQVILRVHPNFIENYGTNANIKNKNK